MYPSTPRAENEKKRNTNLLARAFKPSEKRYDGIDTVSMLSQRDFRRNDVETMSILSGHVSLGWFGESRAERDDKKQETFLLYICLLSYQIRQVV